MGQGPTHTALIPTVCNFMSHEKCLKLVRIPCTSVAPSLVRVSVGLGVAPARGWGMCQLSWG